MADRLTIVPAKENQKKWPKEGDVFYFQLNDGRLGYGMVSLGKIDVGPFKNAIVIYITILHLCFKKMLYWQKIICCCRQLLLIIHVGKTVIS